MAVCSIPSLVFVQAVSSGLPAFWTSCEVDPGARTKKMEALHVHSGSHIVGQLLRNLHVVILSYRYVQVRWLSAC